MRTDKILVPTDFSPTADHALEQAAELASRHGSELHLFHVMEPYGAPPENVMDVVKTYLEKLETEAHARLEERVSKLAGQGITTRSSSAHYVAPFDAIVEKVEELSPDLIVMGTHGRRGFQHMILGSVAEKVLRSVPVNVLSLGLESPITRGERSFGRVLVPVDFSEYSRRALDAAFAVGPKDTEVHVVHVVESPIQPAFYPGPVAAAARPDPDLPARAQSHLDEWLDGRPAELTLRDGIAWREIVDAASGLGVDAIVMGTRGATGLEHMLLGSVSERVVRRAAVPVLVVH